MRNSLKTKNISDVSKMDDKNEIEMLKKLAVDAGHLDIKQLEECLHEQSAEGSPWHSLTLWKICVKKGT